MVNRVEFITDIAQLDFLYVSENTEIFEGYLGYVCDKYQIASDDLQDELERRYLSSVKLLNERLVKDVELDINVEDELEDIPWEDIPSTDEEKYGTYLIEESIKSE
jgi:hypothetical protein